MTMTQKPNKKFEGIITTTVLEGINKETPSIEREYQNFYASMKAFEPVLMEDITVRGNEARDHFRRMGITGATLDELTDALKTFYIRGVLVYKKAIDTYDAKKLQEIYGADYETYLDSLIDEGLAKKRKVKEIESIEPEKEQPKDLDDMME